MVWEDKIIIPELVQFLGTYLIVDSGDTDGKNPGESSGLILPSQALTT